MVHDVLLGRYLHHGEAWYREQVRRANAITSTFAPASEITETRSSPPSALPPSTVLDAMDDLGVALENLHDYDQAIAVMRKKLSLLPRRQVDPAAPVDTDFDDQAKELRLIQETGNLSPEMHHQYTTRANLGTFLIHASIAGALSGDAAAKRELSEGLNLIRESIRLNPGAHFGREKWQAVVVQHFLAVTELPSLLTEFDMLGHPMEDFTPLFARNSDRGLNFLPEYLDADVSIEKRVFLRSAIVRISPDPEWVAQVRPVVAGGVAFDEPTLALIGMWTLGGGPNPHSALALAHICEQIGQYPLAWEGYERATELSEGFSKDAAIRRVLVSHCESRQNAIATHESPANPELWQTTNRARYKSERAWADDYLSRYHDWEAKQIAAGIALDSPMFYEGFQRANVPLPSKIGNADIIAFRELIPGDSLFEALLDVLPLSLAIAGVMMFAGTFSIKWK